jgi:hypothetical protein
MRSPRARSVVCSLVLALAPAVVLLTSSASFAAKPTKPAAKPAAKQKAAAKSTTKGKSASESSSMPAPGMEASKPSTEGYKYETPSPAAPPTPEPLPASTTTETSASLQADKSAAPIAVAENEPVKDVPPAAERSESPVTAEPVPAAAEEPSAPVEPQPVYVEHLGAGAYPGKLRGIYGGSMRLEPSFNGLQWPYMPKSGVGVSGSIWVDSGYENIVRDFKPTPTKPITLPNTSMWVQQSRAVLRVTPTYASGNFFIQGQVELIGNGCQATSSICTTAGTFTTDDLWIRVGQWNAWDLKAGRYEAWELYHTGMGLDVNTLERQGAFLLNPPGNIADAPKYYGVNYLHDRPSDGLGVGYLAFHGYPTNYLRFEVLGELGTTETASTGYDELGGRPSVILDLGWLKLKAGAEYDKKKFSTQQLVSSAQPGGFQTKQDQPYYRTRKGAGGSAQFVIDPIVEFGFNAAYGKVFETQPANSNASGPGSYTTISVGGFANVRLASLWLLGLGANWTTQQDGVYATNATTSDYSAHLQTFVALQYLLARHLFIKGVLGYARADFQDSDVGIPVWSNYMYSARVRLMYLF